MQIKLSWGSISPHQFQVIGNIFMQKNDTKIDPVVKGRDQLSQKSHYFKHIFLPSTPTTDR